MNELRVRRIRFDVDAGILLILILFSQLFFNNGIYLFVGSLIFGWLFYNLQQVYKPSVFTIILVFHFLQIAAGIWLSNYLGVDINYRSDSMGKATIFAFLGLLSLCLPIIYFQNKIPSFGIEQLRVYASKLSIRRVFYAYITGFLLFNTLHAFAFSNEGWTQFILSLTKIKWFFFILFGLLVFLKNEMKIFLIAAVIVEFILGLAAYFSDFKTVTFYLLFVLLFFIKEIKVRHMAGGAVILLLGFQAGIYWTNIKGEYRDFLNKGTKKQTVEVSREEALSKLIELSSRENEIKRNPTVNFLDRLQYTFHLSKVMDRMPDQLPYEYGSNLGRSINFVFTPRLFFPEKPMYDASEKTSKYTGILYSRVSQGTSVSLGYFADCYVDFGYFGMLFPLFLLGLVYGSAYYFLIRKASDNIIFNFAVVGSLFTEFFAIETDSTIIIGRLATNLIAYYLFLFTLFPLLHGFLKESRSRRS